MTEIIPAILTNDISDFRKKYADLLSLAHSGSFHKLHIDFIDGKFLLHKTLMPEDLSFVKTHLSLIAHFMAFNPQKYFPQIKKIGFTTALIHFEAFNHHEEILDAIDDGKSQGLKIGLAVNPETALHVIAKILPYVDIIQLMAVHPGAQGHPFIPETVERITELRKLRRSVIICVDGGIKVGVARECAEAGADILVAGSAILRAEDEEGSIEALKADVETKN